MKESRVESGKKNLEWILRGIPKMILQESLKVF